MKERKPLFIEVSEKIKKDIRKGVYNVILPTEAELTKIYSASRITIRSALQKLNGESIITTMHGKGSYINHQPSGLIPFQLNNANRGFHEWLYESSDDVELKELGHERLENYKSKYPLPVEFASSPVIVIKRLSLLKGQPKIYMEEYLLESLVNEEAFNDKELPTSLYELVSKITGQRVQYTLSRFIPILPPEHVVSALQLENPGTPIFGVAEEHYNMHNQYIIHSMVYICSDMDMQIGIMRTE